MRPAGAGASHALLVAVCHLTRAPGCYQAGQFGTEIKYRTADKKHDSVVFQRLRYFLFPLAQSFQETKAMCAFVSHGNSRHCRPSFNLSTQPKFSEVVPQPAIFLLCEPTARFTSYSWHQAVGVGFGTILSLLGSSAWPQNISLPWHLSFLPLLPLGAL